MKKKLLAGILLLFSFAGMAQDEVKLQNSSTVLVGRILKADWGTLQVMLSDGVEKKIALDVVDSVFTLNDTIRKQLMVRGANKAKLTSRRLAGPRMATAPTAVIIDTSVVFDKVTATRLNETQLTLDKLNMRMIRAGNSLNTAGNCFLFGTLIGLAGAATAIENPEAGIVLAGAGGLLNLIGLGNIMRSGNILNGSKASVINVGLQAHGVGLLVEF